jgi:DNA-binding CsgD family transcriptional regulator
MSRLSMEQVDRFVDASRRSTALEEIASCFQDEVAELGFDRFITLNLCNLSNRPQDMVFLSHYPREWQTRYIEQNYQSIDPYFFGALSELLPFEWDEYLERYRARTGLTKGQLTFFDEAAEVGIIKGMTVPIRLPESYPACVTVAAGKHDSIAEVRHTVHLLSMYFFEAVRRITVVGLKHSGVSLSARETECLQWVAVGKSAWDISRLLGISESTVRFHFKNIRLKFGVSSITHAAVRAAVNRDIEI